MNESEGFAEKYLQQNHLIPIERNYRSRFGEIDLIMQDNDTLVFVEVRQRSSNAFGGAAASIDLCKQRRLILTAQRYVAKLHPTPPCRFDVVLMDNKQGKNLEWIRNAFDAQAFGRLHMN